MRRALIWVITFYRLAISPLKPPCCRFTPTCSAYALEAVLVTANITDFSRIRALKVENWIADLH